MGVRDILRNILTDALSDTADDVEREAGIRDVFRQIDDNLHKGVEEFGVEVRADRFSTVGQSMPFAELLGLVREAISRDRDDVVLLNTDHHRENDYAWLRLRRTGPA